MNREQAEQMNPGDPVTVTIQGKELAAMWAHWSATYTTDECWVRVRDLDGAHPVPLSAVERARMAEPQVWDDYHYWTG